MSAVQSLREFHQKTSRNPLKSMKKDKNTVTRSIGYSADLGCLKEKDLVSGRVKSVGADFVPIGRQTVASIRPLW